MDEKERNLHDLVSEESEIDTDVNEEFDGDFVNNDDSIDYDAGNYPDDINESDLGHEEFVDLPKVEMNEDDIINRRLNPSIDVSKTKVASELPQSNKKGFNPSEVQDARYDDRVEGGVSKNSTTGPMKSFNSSVDGFKLKESHNKVKGSVIVSGFTAQYEENGNIIPVSGEFPFNDIESALASVNYDSFLMPLDSGGFKVTKIIRGAPNISVGDRQVYENIDGKWRRS